MIKQFQIIKDVPNTYPGLRLEPFQVHIKGEVHLIRAGDKFSFPGHKKLRLAVVSLQILSRDKNLPQDKQEAVIDVRYMTRDPNAFLPPELLKNRQIIEMPWEDPWPQPVAEVPVPHLETTEEPTIVNGMFLYGFKHPEYTVGMMKQFMGKRIRINGKSVFLYGVESFAIGEPARSDQKEFGLAVLHHPKQYLYDGYWIITQFFKDPGANLPPRGWSFKVMDADRTDANGNYDWDRYDDPGAFYFCAWCNKNYFGNDQEEAFRTAETIVKNEIHHQKNGNRTSDSGSTEAAGTDPAQPV